MRKYLEEKFKNKKIIILGFGKEGRSSLAFFRKHMPELDVAVADENGDLVNQVSGIKRYFGSGYLEHLKEFDVAIKSPGVSSLNPKIVSAVKNGLTVTSQTKIFFDLVQGKIVGITGTKGKSTTTSLIYQMARKWGLDACLVGNIGNPALDALEGDNPARIYIFELSSHQLYDLDRSPHIALVTNVSVDHLDWYGNFENYVDAKTHIVKYQSDDDIAILNWDNLVARGFSRFTRGPLYYVSKSEPVRGAYYNDGFVFLNISGNPEKLGNINELKLLGLHNVENVMAAAVASKLLGISNQTIWQSAVEFLPLEHHLEFVGRYKGVDIYNDSFAVDQIATVAAINSFNKNIVLILGGYDRGIDYSELCETITQKDHVKSVVLIGEISEKLKALLRKKGYTGKVKKLGKVPMKKIVATALKIAENGEILLFSPAAASFDMFKDYKDRGFKFKEEVKVIIDGDKAEHRK